MKVGITMDLMRQSIRGSPEETVEFMSEMEIKRLAQEELALMVTCGENWPTNKCMILYALVNWAS
jgi:hypothetical protein